MTVAVDCVYRLSQNETWRYKLQTCTKLRVLFLSGVICPESFSFDSILVKAVHRISTIFVCFLYFCHFMVNRREWCVAGCVVDTDVRSAALGAPQTVWLLVVRHRGVRVMTSSPWRHGDNVTVTSGQAPVTRTHIRTQTDRHKGTGTETHRHCFASAIYRYQLIMIIVIVIVITTITADI